MCTFSPFATFYALYELPDPLTLAEYATSYSARLLFSRRRFRCYCRRCPLLSSPFILVTAVTPCSRCRLPRVRSSLNNSCPRCRYNLCRLLSSYSISLSPFSVAIALILQVLTPLFAPTTSLIWRRYVIRSLASLSALSQRPVFHHCRPSMDCFFGLQQA